MEQLISFAGHGGRLLVQICASESHTNTQMPGPHLRYMLPTGRTKCSRRPLTNELPPYGPHGPVSWGHCDYSVGNARRSDDRAESQVHKQRASPLSRSREWEWLQS